MSDIDIDQLAPCDFGPNVKPGVDPQFDYLVDKMGKQGVTVSQFLECMQRLNVQDPKRGLSKESV
jgi:hypothetical protein